MSDLSSLIARLEKAEGPSRDLDVEIMNTLDPRSPDEKRLFDGKVYPATWGAVGQVCDHIRYFVEAPFLTYSIDAAVSLAERVVGEDKALAIVAQVSDDLERDTMNGSLRRFPLSLVIATLRALDQKGSES